jgi:hypothetical protein
MPNSKPCECSCPWPGVLSSCTSVCALVFVVTMVCVNIHLHTEFIHLSEIYWLTVCLEPENKIPFMFFLSFFLTKYFWGEIVFSSHSWGAEASKVKQLPQETWLVNHRSICSYNPRAMEIYTHTHTHTTVATLHCTTALCILTGVQEVASSSG